jgi:hypothetical protein
MATRAALACEIRESAESLQNCFANVGESGESTNICNCNIGKFGKWEYLPEYTWARMIRYVILFTKKTYFICIQRFFLSYSANSTRASHNLNMQQAVDVSVSSRAISHSLAY